MEGVNKKLRALLEAYPIEVRNLALETRNLVRTTIPDLQEIVDEPARIIGYGFGAGYTDLICTIILSKRGIKLGINRGATLLDPHRLLAGTGKVHRYVAIDKTPDLKKSGLRQLLKAAVQAWKVRVRS